VKILSKIILISLSTLLLIGIPTDSIYGQDGDNPPAPSLPVDRDLRFEHITTIDGLSEGRVWSITQDRRGFMWFTTYDGLNRYDGYEFTSYKQERDNPNSPGGTAFWAVAEDRQGMIWAGSHTGGGLSRFDPTSEQWTRFQNDPDDPHSLSSNNVYVIIEDSNGVLWIGTEGGGLNRFNPQNETFTHYRNTPDDPRSLSLDFAVSIYEDSSSTLWVGTYGGGLNRFDPQTETFTRYQNDPEDLNSLSHDSVFSIYEDRFGILWVGTWGGGLNRFDPQTETFIRYQLDSNDSHSLSGNTVIAFCEDQSGDLWVGTYDGGLNRFSRETGSFTSYQHNYLDPRSLGSSSVSALYVDHSGIIWIGVSGRGISKLDPTAQEFALYQHKGLNSNSLSNSNVRAVFEDRFGMLWIGTWGGGLNRFNPQTGKFRHYLHDPADPKSLSNNHVWTILEDSTGTLWVGLNGGGLNKFDRETGTFTRFQHDPTNAASLGHKDVTTLYEDHTGILWIGTWSGGLDALNLQSMDGKTNFIHYRHESDDPRSLGAGTIYSIYEDRAGVLWVGTGGGGLCRFDRDTQNFACYTNNPDDVNSLSHDTIWVIHEDQKGTLWVGTSDGINRFESQDGSFFRYSQADGLPHDTVYGILEDEEGRLWLSTDGGISHFDPQSLTFRNYDASDGLQGNNFHSGAYAKSRDGELFFGGPDGLTAFYPQELRSNLHVPPIYVTDIQLSNKPVTIGGDSPLQKSIVDTQDLVLSHEEHVISFKFTALSYNSPNKNRYRYMLEGFDNEWVEVDSDQRYATYTNLDPGEYVFKVIGSNNDGVWNEEGTSIHLTITPPWQETVWFRGIVLLVFLGLVIGGYRWRVVTVERRSRELEGQVAERTQDLSDRAAELAVLNQIAQMVTTMTDLQTVLESVSQEVSAIFEACFVYILMPTEPENKTTVIYGCDRKTGLLKPLPLDPTVTDTPLFQWLFSPPEPQAVSASDRLPQSLTDLHLLPQALSRGEPQADSLLDKLSLLLPPVVLEALPPGNLSSAMLIPLVMRGETIGILFVATDQTDHGYTTTDVSLAETIAGDLASAVENTRLLEQAQSEAVAEERSRLARELHDSVTQTMYSVSMMAEALPRIWDRNPAEAKRNTARLRQLTLVALTEMRALLFELRPDAFEDASLGALLHQLSDVIIERGRIPVELTIDGDGDISQDIKIAMYRTTQEAFSNILKHAEATQVVVTLCNDPDQVKLTICDNGQGFDPENITAENFGISIMRERAEGIAAKFQIESAPGEGTKISVTCPDQVEGD